MGWLVLGYEGIVKLKIGEDSYKSNVVYVIVRGKRTVCMCVEC